MPPKFLDKVAGGVELTRDVCSIQFREPDEEEEIRCTPGMRAEGRGRSILKKETANTATGAILRQPHTIDDVPSGVGSPLTKHPGNRIPSGDFSFSSGFQSQLKGFQSQAKAMYDSYMSLKQSYTSLKRLSSRKRECQTQSKPLVETHHPVASAEDRPTTVSGDRGPEGAAQKGQKHATRPVPKMTLPPSDAQTEHS